MKILICFGTRPEAIKMAPVYLHLKQRFNVKLCVTAQHREMLDQVLSFFDIQPDYDLDLMKQNQSLNGLFASILNGIDGLFKTTAFDVVLVHGDTTTSTAVALAAFHHEIKVGHIEAGLRTYNKKSPFPEEINRQLTAKLADYHFAPTQTAYDNLVREGITSDNIILTGNTVIDALKITLDKLDKGFENSQIKEIKDVIDNNKKTILVTGHRRESFGKGLENICIALKKIAKGNDVQIVYPVHLNPKVQKSVYAILNNTTNIILLNPLNYPAFIYLMSKSDLIISDSGGIQEEAPTFKIPVLVTRNTTERMESINNDFSILVGTDSNKIVNTTNEILKTPLNLAEKENPYGDGKSSNRISKFLNEV